MPNTIKEKINQQDAKERRTGSMIKPYIYFCLEIALILEFSYLLFQLEIYLWLIITIAMTYMLLRVIKLMEILQRERELKVHHRYRSL